MTNTLTLDRAKLRESGLELLIGEDKIDHVLGKNITYVVFSQQDLNERLIRYEPAPMHDDENETGKEHLVQIVLHEGFDKRKKYLCCHKLIWFDMYKGLTIPEIREREMYRKRGEL